ncbi:hypothetical protein BCR43DRAFT_486321 [Syncephalastrum racemosum]|uniref:EamA domain-containing protein n=1 Tax=Syncephalastrum racemosum TaxID=13706 RepID=A0A1X2HNW7_SYNRA|nr:hypothetical protein BCR43DRAFT_486321 [Syncephalastrum racemosum]
MAGAAFIPLAVLSGIFASLSSVFAKLFTDTRTTLLHDRIVNYATALNLTIPFDPEISLLGLRGLCFGLIFACNSLMWTLFTKALNAAPSSVQTTTVNGAVNLTVSALLGYLIFEEPLALGWWIGASFILSGTLLLSRAQKQKTD